MRLLRRSALFCPRLAHSAVAPRLLVVLISLVIAGASGARAQNIDTTPAWNGTSSLNSWGEPNTATYAQTITAPSTPNLTSFTFYLAQINGVAPSFQAHVYAWDNLNGRATGSALFSSAIMVAPVSSSFTPVTINTGATQLTPGQTYVLLLTTAGLPNPAAGAYKWGYTQTNSYTGGGAAFNNNGDNLGQLTVGGWVTGINDFAFIAMFGPGGVSIDGLNDNQTNIANSINGIITAGGSPDFSPLAMALMGLPAGQLPGALDQLSPEIYSYEKIETLYAAEQFSSDLQSCRVADGSGYSVIREGQCLWARARARFLDLDTTGQNIGADSTVGSFSAGAQVALAEDVRLGFAAGYDIISLGTGTGASAEGERTNLGAVAKYNPGPWLFSAAVAGGWGDYDTTRNMAFGGFAGQATGDSDIDYLQGRLHAAYLIQQAGWYAKPLIDATLTELDFDGGTETGGGGAALIVASDSDTYWAISPALEVGSEYRLSALSVLRPFLRGGVTWRDGDNVDLRAGFAAAPAGIGAFTINTAVDDVLADVAAGIDVINAKGAVLRLQYDGRFGEETQQNSASIKGSVPF